MLTSEQIRAARSLLRVEQSEIAGAAHISVQTLKRLEGGKGPLNTAYQTAFSLRALYESLGIIFIDQDDKGPGVRLRDRIEIDDEDLHGALSRSIKTEGANDWYDGRKPIPENKKAKERGEKS